VKKNIFRAAFVAATIAASWLSPITSALASQNSCILPNSGTLSGLALVNDANACINSLLSLYSGPSAPSAPFTGMLWFDTTTNYVQQFDGTDWNNFWFVDAVNHIIVPPVGGGFGSLASNTTTDVGSVPQAAVTITGTTTITSLGTSAIAGSLHFLTFSNSLVLTRNVASLIVPGITNITTQPGDTAIAMYLGGGNWQIVSYNPASGAAVINSAFPLGTVLYGDYGTVPAKFVYGFGQALTRTSFVAYLAAVTRVQSGTLTSGNATITSIGNTQGFGAGMPVEAAGVNAGCTIASVVPNTSVTLNAASCVTANGSTPITVFLTGYGSGGSGSTVGVKDCRGRTMAGRDDLGGTAAGRLTSQTSDNNGIGSPTATLRLTDLPAGITSSGPATGSITGTATSTSDAVNGQSGADTVYPTTSSQAGTFSMPVSGTFSGTANVTSNNTGGTNVTTIPPTVVSDCIVAVLP
jgi:hypothetical protein